MTIQSLQKWFTTPVEKKNAPQFKFWLGLSLLITITYGLQAIIPSFQNEYIMQDDARQHVFWTLRLWDSGLFKDDLIADFYQSSAPLGYTGLYKFLAIIGINPILVSKLLPLGLGLLATVYGFNVSLEILPVPAAGFINTLLLNQMLWGNPILVGATPRAFTYPLFLIFLYYLLKRSLIPCLIAIALQGLFYPPGILISAGILILRLLRWKHGLGSGKSSRLPSLILERNHLLLSLAGLGVIFLVLLPELLSKSEFGPVISVAQAQKLPEFQPGGRVAFFTNNFWDFWFNNQRSGIGYLQWFPPLLYLALFVPIMLRYPSRFPLARQIKANIIIFLQLIITSIGLFLLAHAVLFKLYLPSRYIIGISLSTYFLTGIGLIIILDAIFKICEQSKKITLKILCLFLGIYSGVIFSYWYLAFYPSQKKYLIVWLALGIGITLIYLGFDLLPSQTRENQKSYPRQEFLALVSTTIIFGLLFSYPSWVKEFPRTDYSVGKVPQLYSFLAQQPKDSLIASLTWETDNLSSFAQRSVLVSREYALPYQVGYYNQLRQRITDLIKAQYSPNLEEVKDFIEKYGIDFWLVEHNTFTANYINKPDSWENRLTSSWLLQYPETTKALENIEQGLVPALAKVQNRCSVLKVENLVLINAKCVAQFNELP